MKRVIRRNIYETNSSSAHSLIVTKNDRHVDPEKIVWDNTKEFDRDDNIYLGRDGELSLYNIEYGFGRAPFTMLTSFEDKLKYAMCEYLGYLYPDDPEWDKLYGEFEEICRDTIPGFKGFDIHKKDIDIYLDQNGDHIMQKDLHYDHWNKEEERAEYYYIDDDGSKHPAIFDTEDYMEMDAIGTIDHQSAGMLKGFINKKGITLKEFLTNKKYIVVIDGDEYCDFPRYLHSGLIDINFITEIYGAFSDAMNDEFS